MAAIGPSPSEYAIELGAVVAGTVLAMTSLFIAKAFLMIGNLVQAMPV